MHNDTFALYWAVTAYSNPQTPWLDLKRVYMRKAKKEAGLKRR